LVTIENLDDDSPDDCDHVSQVSDDDADEKRIEE
jgi:hypothetical protein